MRISNLRDLERMGTGVWFVVEMCKVEMVIVRITSRQTIAG